MKKEFILPLLTVFAFACQNANHTQAIEQEVSTAKHLLSEENARNAQMKSVGDQVEALPEKFKAENPEAFSRMAKYVSDVNNKRNRCLEMLQEGANQTEELLKSKAADMQQQFEGQVQPKLKDASESIKRYDQDLERLKVKTDSISKAYGG